MQVGIKESESLEVATRVSRNERGSMGLERKAENDYLREAVQALGLEPREMPSPEKTVKRQSSQTLFFTVACDLNDTVRKEPRDELLEEAPSLQWGSEMTCTVAKLSRSVVRWTPARSHRTQRGC